MNRNNNTDTKTTNPTVRPAGTMVASASLQDAFNTPKDSILHASGVFYYSNELSGEFRRITKQEAVQQFIRFHVERDEVDYGEVGLLLSASGGSGNLSAVMN